MDELKKKLLEDIEKTGFPSELKAARVFAEYGHTVAHTIRPLQVRDFCAAAYSRRVVKLTGDGALVEFGSASG
jgi:hypothetical protein